MRRFFVLFVALLLVFTFGVMAGGQKEGTAGAQGKIVYGGWLRSWGGTNLVFSSHQGPTTDAAAFLAKKFEQLTGAKVTVLAEPWTDLLTKHTAAFAAHSSEYDVITFPYIWFGNYVQGKMIDSLDDWFAKKDLVDPNYGMDDFIPAVLEAYGKYRIGTYASDALWSVPYKFDIYLAQYRKDLFKQAGIVDSKGNAKPPATWDELIQDAKTLAAKVPDVTPVVLPLQVDDPMAATMTVLLGSYGNPLPQVWYDKNVYPLFERKAGVQGATTLQGLMPYMPKDVLSYDYDKVNEIMAQGQAAYALNWNAYLPVLVDPSKSKITDTVGFALAPGGPSGRPQGLGGWQMSIYALSKNKVAAFQLLQFITGQPQAVDYAMHGASVARYSVAKDPTVIKALPFYPLLLEALKSVAMRGEDTTWVQVQNKVAIAFNKVLLGAPTDQTLKGAADEVYDLAKNAGYHPEQSGPRP